MYHSLFRVVPFLVVVVCYLMKAADLHLTIVDYPRRVLRCSFVAVDYTPSIVGLGSATPLYLEKVGMSFELLDRPICASISPEEPLVQHWGVA